MANEFNLDEILKMFSAGPTPQERQEAASQAFARAGMGILAGNQPSATPRNPYGILGQGGMAGLGAYDESLKGQLAERKAGGAAMLQAMQFRKLMNQQEALRKFGQGDSGATAAPPGPTPPGFSAGSSQAIFGTPEFATKAVPPAANASAQVPNFSGLLAEDVPPAVVTAMMEDWKLKHPKLENVPGIGMVHPYSGGVLASMPRITDTGRAAGAIPDGLGGWRVQVPQGSVDAYSQFQNADEIAKARNDLVTVPATSAGAPPTYASRLSLLPGGGGPAGPGGSPRAAGMSPAATSEQAAAAAQQLKIGENYAQIYNNTQNAAMANPAKISKLQRIGTLLGDFEGGKLSGAGMEVARTANSLGLRIDSRLPNKEAAEALSNAVALENRSTAEGNGMPGAMSDADRNFLKAMSPQMAQTAEGRKTIIDARVKIMQRESQVAAMARQYKQKYGALNEDFFTQLSGWSERNPIFNK